MAANYAAVKGGDIFRLNAVLCREDPTNVGQLRLVQGSRFAIEAIEDQLFGLKEKDIIGKLIPASTAIWPTTASRNLRARRPCRSGSRPAPAAAYSPAIHS